MRRFRLLDDTTPTTTTDTARVSVVIVAASTPTGGSWETPTTQHEETREGEDDDDDKGDDEDGEDDEALSFRRRRRAGRRAVSSPGLPGGRRRRSCSRPARAGSRARARARAAAAWAVRANHRIPKRMTVRMLEIVMMMMLMMIVVVGVRAWQQRPHQRPLPRRTIRTATLPSFFHSFGRDRGGGAAPGAARTRASSRRLSASSQRRAGSKRSDDGGSGSRPPRGPSSFARGFSASAVVGRLFSSGPRFSSNHNNGTTGDAGWEVSRTAGRVKPLGGNGSVGTSGNPEAALATAVVAPSGVSSDDVNGNLDAVDSSSDYYDDDYVDDDFEAWALGLGQWPLVPDVPPARAGRKTSLLTDDDYDEDDSGSGNPRASLLDLEALWRALQLRGVSPATGEAEEGEKGTAPATPSDAGQADDAADKGSILDGLYGILSIERILRAGNLFQVFESDRSESPEAPQPKAAGPLVPAEATNATSTVSSPTLFQQATSQLESFVGDASSLFASPSIVMDFIGQAAQVLQESTKNTTQTLWAIRELQKRQDEEEGARTDVDAVDGESAGGGVPREDEAERRVRDALAFSANLVAVADAVLRQGYVSKRPSLVNKTAEATAGAPPRSLVEKGAVPPRDASRALFADFVTAREVPGFSPWLAKGAEMGALSGAIYEQTVPRTHALNHTIAANGVTADVAWMVTDALGTDASFASTTVTGSPRHPNGTAPLKVANVTATPRSPFLVRTITLRGFDASDENVDREGLLMRVCTANPETFKTRKGSVVQFHSGMWGMARALYRDLKPYVSWTAPSHKIVFAGHSVGGSLAVLVLLLMTMDMGPDFVASKVLRVFTYGSPPVARRRFETDEDRHRNARRLQESPSTCRCDVLEAFDLPASLVEGYVQPWDPIVRLFSEIDPLYPLLGDVGADGVTPWASGPPRTLRPITKAIMEAWEGWPRFRDTMASTGNQTYRAVGVQHVLIPEPTRYLADRFVGVNVQVPPVTTLLRISSHELLPALQLVFPLDVFEISFVPQAIRSFVHHFYPAYGFPLVDYVKRLEAPPVISKQSSPKDVSFEKPASGDDAPFLNVEDDLRRKSADQTDLMADLGRAAQWLRGNDPP